VEGGLRWKEENRGGGKEGADRPLPACITVLQLNHRPKTFKLGKSRLSELFHFSS
jgi:hypothetical protein